MQPINTRRWIISGLAAGILIWILEGLASQLYYADMQAALAAHGLSMDMSFGVMAITVLVSLLYGWTMAFLYAAVRPRFGPGPRTAIVVGLTVWVAGYVVSLLGLHMMGLFPAGMLFVWGGVGLVESLLAAQVAGWLYREA